MTCSPLLTELGQRIRKIVNSKEAYQILDDFGAKSWTSGGCQIVAISITAWLGDVVPVWLVSENGYEHTIVRIGGCYLDADGASTERQLLKRWKILKKVKQIEAKDARWVSLHPEDFDFDGGRCQLEIVYRLVELLYQKIGPGMEIMHEIEREERS